MSERGILFSGPMVNRINAPVDPKTVTRRLVTFEYANDIDVWCRSKLARHFDGGCYGDGGACARMCTIRSPYDVGDRLWVRETWRAIERLEDNVDGVLYRADGAFVRIEDSDEAIDQWVVAYNNGKHGNNWRPAIYMPRWAARTTLRVLDVRIERLQALTADEAKREGARRFDDIPDPNPYGHGSRWSMESPMSTDQCLGSPQMAFANLWNKLNGERADWDSNPWIWRIEFERE